MKIFWGKKSGEWASMQKKGRKSNGTQQKNKTGESKVESNDSSEISGKGETSDIPGLPLGDDRSKREKMLMFQFLLSVYTFKSSPLLCSNTHQAVKSILYT